MWGYVKKQMKQKILKLRVNKRASYKIGVDNTIHEVIAVILNWKWWILKDFIHGSKSYKD